MFWPGSEAAIKGVRPTYSVTFNGSLANLDRVKQLVTWLELPIQQRPQLLMLYFNDVDTAGHRFGAESAEVRAAIASVDASLAALRAALVTRGYWDRTDVVVTSDHGMTAVTARIFLDDYLNLTTVHIADYGSVAAIFVSEGQEANVMAQLNGAHPNMTVYLKANVPFRFHYQHNARIAPIVAFADETFYILPSRATPYTDVATHGYDNDAVNMQSLFIATGPGFTANRTIDTMNSVDVYALVCYRLGVSAAPNNGSLDTLLPYLRR